MHLQSHIIKTIPIFKINDPIKDVIQLFESTTYSHVGVLDGDTYVGVLSENDLATFEKNKFVFDYKYNLEMFFISSDNSWLDALEVFARNDANVLPVLDQDRNMLGYYSLPDIVGIFIETPFFTEQGSVMVVSKGVKDYSFSEIAQIVESNNARLIGAFITDMTNDIVQVTLKVVSASMNEISQTFRRYNYAIDYGTTDDLFLEDLKDRSNYLDKYLNV